MSDTSTSRCPPGDGPLSMSDSSSFEEAWRVGQLPSKKLGRTFHKILTYFGLQDHPHDLRVADRLEDTDGACQAPYGRYIRIILSPECGRGTSEPATYVVATLVHEVLHILFWESDAYHEAAIDDPKLSAVLSEVRDHLVDKLAWTLLPHIVPDLDPTEDLFREDLHSIPTYVFGHDPGDEYNGSGAA